ncbi:MAG: hypothetical protein ACM3KM_02395 [Acidobacteriaceae bacterium]
MPIIRKETVQGIAKDFANRESEPDFLFEIGSVMVDESVDSDPENPTFEFDLPAKCSAERLAELIEECKSKGWSASKIETDEGGSVLIIA